MDLKTYLISKDGRAHRDGNECRRVAKAARYSPYTLYMIALGHKLAEPVRALSIEKATKGAVSRSDLRADLWPMEKAA